MYCNFFGFSGKPFDVTPDPRFLYFTAGHRETLASLVYGIRERRGFMTVVGEVGTGKTTLLNAVMDQLDQTVRVAFIFNTSVTFDEMVTMALLDLKLVGPQETVSRVEALTRLKGFAIHELSRGGNVVLIVDEAQNLEPSAMENVRLLSNLETREHKLIQIVLSGQPELDVKLNKPELRQLSQRISLRRYIIPLSEEETYQYIQHRLNVANYNGPVLFDGNVQQLIWEHCDGIPRKINVLCDNALLIGYALRQKTIDRTVIEEVIKDISWSPFVGPKEIQATTHVQDTPRSRKKPSHPRFAKAAILVVASCTIFLGFLLGFLVSSGSWPSLEDSGSISLSGKVRAEASQQDGAKIERMGEPSPNLEDFKDGWTEGGDRVSSIGKASESRSRESRVAVAKRGENLSWIISETYGRYDKGILSAVLRENPEIQDPDRITVGQVIKLPEKQ